jgi:ABC-type nitrate/sulfonate/bicarbonate transport system permease component
MSTGAEAQTAVLPARPLLSRAAAVRLTRWGILVVALALWQFLARNGASDSLLPPPSIIAGGLVAIFSDAGVVHALLWALIELAAAFALSVVIGSVVGYLVSVRLGVERVAMPILLLLYAIPQVTILPLFILYFGLGPASKIAFGVSHGLFPVALSVVAGLNAVKPHYLRWADSLGASRSKRILRVLLPQALPSLCTGMRLGMSTTLLGVLLAEIYVSSSGVGFYTQVFTDSSQGGELFALVFTLAAIAVVLTGAVRVVERRAARWRT